MSYAAAAGAAEKGNVVIDGETQCETIAAGAPISADAIVPAAKPKAPIPSFAFQIMTSYKLGKRAFIFAADSEAERDGWIKAVNDVIANPALHVALPTSPTPALGGAMGALGSAMQMAKQAKPLLQVAGQMAGVPSMPSMPGNPLAGATSPKAAAAPKAAASAAPIKTFSGKMIPPFPPSTGQVLGVGGNGSAPNMMAMLSSATAMMGALKTQQSNPMLSAQDNALNMAQAVQGAAGLTGRDQQLRDTLQALEALLPPGHCGFVVTEPPGPGTLGQMNGLATYDLIYAFEGQRVDESTTQAAFGAAKTAAFQTKGAFQISVYNFVSEQSREVSITMPAGLPNAILGIASSMLPLSAGAAAAAAPVSTAGLVTKGWIKSGAMYVSAGANAYPIDGPLTAENEAVFVQVFRQSGSMMIGTGEYHPLYNYSQLAEPLFVESWQVLGGGMLMQSGNKYAPLPMTRSRA